MDSNTNTTSLIPHRSLLDSVSEYTRYQDSWEWEYSVFNGLESFERVIFQGDHNLITELSLVPWILPLVFLIERGMKGSYYLPLINRDWDSPFEGCKSSNEGKTSEE